MMFYNTDVHYPLRKQLANLATFSYSNIHFKIIYFSTGKMQSCLVGF